MSSIARPRTATETESDALSRSKAISIELRRVARRARVPRPITSGGGGFRARRTDRFYRAFFLASFFVVFVGPVLFGAAYFTMIASDQYISEARFMVRSGDQTGLESMAGIASILGSSSQASDGQIIAEYVESREVVQEIQKVLDLRRMFNPGTWDFIAEAPTHLTIEEFVDYWNGQVKLSVDNTSGLVTLRVRTFTPEDSLKLSREIVGLSEKMVNRLMRRNEANVLEEASRELTNAKKRLETATAAMRDARNEVGILDVDLAAKSYSELLTQLHIELSKTETQIISLKENDAQDAPQLAALQARADALSQQITAYENKIAGQIDPSRGDSPLAARATILADKQVELTIARNEYTLAVATYERARLNSERQRSYLLTYVPPSLAEESRYPRRGLMIVIVTVISFLLWAVVAGLAILIRDNTAA